MREGPSLFSSARLIALCTLVSRVTGLLRDMLMAYAFGLSWVQDAFNYGFLVPNLFRRLFGEGALTAVFVPTFTKTLETAGRPAAWRLLAQTLSVLVVALTGVTILIELAVCVAWWLSPEGDPQRAGAQRLLLGLTAVMLPFMLFVCVLALFAAILNCVGRFVPGALASVVLNLTMIAGIAFFGPWWGGDLVRSVYGIAASVVLAGALQLVFILPFLRAEGVALGWEWAPRSPEVRRMIGLMGPVAVGQGLLLLSTWLDVQIAILLTHVHGGPERGTLLGLSFAYPLQEGAVSAVTAAQRLYQFPLGVLVISLATAALPSFSRLAARGDYAAWAGQVRETLRLAVFEGLLAACVMVTVATPIVRLLFEYGRFDEADTRRAAYVLACYGFGMWAFCAQHIVLRAFYSLGDVRTPLRVSAVLLPLNVAITLALVWLPGVREAAFAISSAVTSGLAVVAGLLILQRRTHAPLLTAGAGRALAAMLAAAVAGGLAAWLLAPWVAPLPDGALFGGAGADAGAATALGRAAEAGVLILAGGGVYVGVSALLGLGEARLLLRRKRQPPAPAPG